MPGEKGITISTIFGMIGLLLVTEPARALMDDDEFFRSLNLNRPGFHAVVQALDAGDTMLAKQKLLEYYQNRSSVIYFPLQGSGKRSQADDNVNHYFKVNGVRLFAGQNDGTIDWSTYYPADKEWHYQFHRMYWIVNYGRVYASTGEEKYAVEWIHELTDWVRDNSPGYPRTLDTGIRLQNWVESFQYFVHAHPTPSLDGQDLAIILKSLLEQCRFLRDHWRSDGNWGASETRGLGAVVVMFPEFKFTPDGDWEWWRDLVLSRLEHHLTNDFYPDGVQFETSPSYHSLEYRNLFLTYKLMDLNGITIHEGLKELFVKPLEFMMHIHMPDGYLPQLSDTDRKSYLDRLKEGAELFSRQDMIYAATRGKQGTPPKTTFASFPDGGYFIMRSDWGQHQAYYADSKYLVFDTGSNEPWHAHFDILNLVAYANGSSLIRDAGRYTYVAGPWRDYFKGTAAHNTIVIDGENQKQHSAGTPLKWGSLPALDYVLGEHNAYTGLSHQREIFFVRPDYWIICDWITGSGTHRYDLYFHLDSPYWNHTTLQSNDHSLRTPNFSITPSDTMSSAEVLTGWVSNKYNSKTRAPVVHYGKYGQPPVTFETILFPFSSASDRVSVRKHRAFAGIDSLSLASAFGLQIQLAARTDWFFRNRTANGLTQINIFQTDGEAGLVRQNPDGTTDSFQLTGGTYLTHHDSSLIDLDGNPSEISVVGSLVWLQSNQIYSGRIWAPQAESLLVNGKSIHFTRNGEYIEFITSEVQRIKSTRPSEFQTFLLLQNYPNPFNQTTTIPFILKRPAVVQLQIYDLLGRRVATLISHHRTAGVHSVTWNPGREQNIDLPSGIYLCRMRVADQIAVRRIILLK